MPRRLSALALVALVAALLAPVASAAPTAAPTATAATTVCTNVARCQVLGSVDVDGDGRADQIGIVNGTIDGIGYWYPAGQSTVRVRTATGRIMSATSKGITWHTTNAHFATAPVDGRRGNEIILGSKRGALLGDISYSGASSSTRGYWTEFHVLTVRNGALVTLPSPVSGSSAGTARWRVTEGDYPAVGFSREVVNGVTYLRRSQAQPRPYPSTGWTRTTVKYRWGSNGWSKVSSAKGSVTRATGRSTAWWRMTGVPGFAQCGDIVFTPQSDNMATTIGALGTTCTSAKYMVKTADNRSFSSDRIARIGDYLCTYYVDESGLSGAMYTCRSGRKMIAWRRY